MFFSKKSKIEEAKKRSEEAKRKELEKIKKIAQIQLPKKSFGEEFKATEYTDFLAEIKTKPKTKYEIACSIAEKILPIKPDEKTYAKLEEELKTAYINATPKGSLSLTYLSGILGFMIMLFAILIGADFTFAIILFLVVGGFAYYVYNYPTMQSRIMSMKMSADTVLAILYMG
ncbi:MAG: hypothetical protein PHU12_03170, partial [Candidatus Aenigmarchaeota archaeon]|nr:hypothetical protein [Candidatus Aenigmarchaeota archaeon]